MEIPGIENWKQYRDTFDTRSIGQALLGEILTHPSQSKLPVIWTLQYLRGTLFFAHNHFTMADIKSKRQSQLVKNHFY